MKEKKYLKRIIIIIVFLVSLFILGINIFYINNINENEDSQINYMNVKQILISGILIICIIVFSLLYCKIHINKALKKIIILTLLFLYTVCQIFWIQNTFGEQFADSQIVITTAEEIYDNKKDLTYKEYIQYYTQQLNLSVFFASIYKIFNTNNIRVLQYFNIISNTLTILGLYLIVLKIQKNNEINKILFWVLSLTFIPIIMLSMFVYGDFIGLSFAIYSIYFSINYIEKKKKRYLFISSIFLSIACFIRMNYSILIIANVIYWIIEFCYNKKGKRSLVILILNIVVFISISVLPNKIINNIMIKKYNLNPEKSFSSIIYIYMGMSESDRGNGWYNPEIHEIITESMKNETNNKEILNQKCIPRLKDRVKYLIQNPIYTLNFYCNKLVTIWTDSTMQCKFYNSIYPQEKDISSYKVANELLNGDSYEYIVIYSKAIVILIFAGTMMTIVINKTKINNEILFLCIFFLGGCAFHFLWEAKSRYIISYVVILIPVACMGITQTIDIIINRIKKIFRYKEGKRNEEDISSSTNVL